jgi:hypothetical protein
MTTCLVGKSPEGLRQPLGPIASMLPYLVREPGVGRGGSLWQSRAMWRNQRRDGMRTPVLWLLGGAVIGTVVFFLGGSRLLDAFYIILAGGIILLTFPGVLFFPAVTRELSYVYSTVLAFAVFAISPITVAEKDFYSISAQIAPVLLLAVAFETRAYRGKPLDSSDRLALFMLIVLILIAGGESLRVLAIGEAGDGFPNIVIGALAGASLQLLILGSTEASRSDPE